MKPAMHVFSFSLLFSLLSAEERKKKQSFESLGKKKGYIDMHFYYLPTQRHTAFLLASPCKYLSGHVNLLDKLGDSFASIFRGQSPFFCFYLAKR